MKSALAAGFLLASQSFALTGSPTMPEYTQFEEVSGTNLVDPHSGNFTYTIPLMEVPGPEGTYPLALGYHAGIRYNQEASWVGLGWNLNPGAINRILRGVPDDYYNSMVTTRNVAKATGHSINVNVAYAGFGMSMAWDMDKGTFLGATPSYTYTLGYNVGAGVNIGLSVTFTPGAFSVGAGMGLPIGNISMGLYDSRTNSAGGVGFTPGLGGFSLSHRTGASIGSSAGQGDVTTSSVGVTIPVWYYTTVGVEHTRWRYSLDEALVDYMCGYLFQDGKGKNAGFKEKVPGAIPYKFGTNKLPRQRFDRSKTGDGLFPASDVYQVSGNGMAGSFSPMIQPGGPQPVYRDGAVMNDEGYIINSPAAFTDITWRMDGDQGYNLLHGDNVGADAIAPDVYNASVANRTQLNQYGTYRIVPSFNKLSDGTFSNVLVGFTIRNPEGLTYEYHQPVYSRLQADYMFKDPNLSTKERSQKVNAEKYATSWLLTAVKGVDYLKPSSSGSPVPGDMGHWVKFTYTTPGLQNWSTPFSGNLPQEFSSTYYNRSFGIRDQVFLSAIETETHKATFSTIDREDVPKSPNSPVRAAPTANEMTFDEGASASSFFPVPPATLYDTDGGFPLQLTDHLLPTGNNRTLTYSAKFRFPGDWGKFIIQYRKANCGGEQTQCSLEKFIGFHLKYDWLKHTSNEFLATDDYAFAQGTKTEFKKSWSSLGVDYTRTYSWQANCKDVVVVDGDTEMRCDMNFGIGGNDARHIRVYTAFFNWPEFEAKGLFNYVKPKALAGIQLTHKASNKIVKEIRFGYDYSLCKNLPTNGDRIPISTLAATYPDNFVSTDNAANTGKLTLRKVRVYGEGGMAAHNANGALRIKLPDYSFDYQSGAEGNPDYVAASAGGVYKLDTWGMFSPASTMGSHRTRQVNTAAAGTPPNGGEKVGVAWNLQKITLPTGGSISLDYQRDEYYFAGLHKDGNTADYVPVPDIFNLEFPTFVNGVNGPTHYDWMKYWKLGTETAWKDFKIADLQNNKQTLTQTSLKTSDLSSDNVADDYPITTNNAAPVELRSGDMALVVYTVETGGGVDGNRIPASFTTKFTGVQTIAIVDRPNDGNRVKLRPLFRPDTDGRWRFINNFWVSSSGAASPNEAKYESYRVTYYLVPIRNSARRFYGGDIAVKSLRMEDGFGKSVTKYFEYSGRRKDAAGNFAGPETYSMGATWLMPQMGEKDLLKRYMTLQNGFGWLHFQPWPTFAASGSLDPVLPLTWTKNPLSDALLSAYQSVNLPGGEYYPQAGVTYARGTEKLMDGGAGTTEFQFYNLAYKYLNAGTGFDAGNPAKNHKFTDWVVSGTAPNFTVNANLVPLNGKLMRQRQLASGGKIVKSHTNAYANRVDIYKNAAEAASGIQLGAVQQKNGYAIGAADNTAATYFNVRVPNAYLVQEEDILDNVRSLTTNANFDAKSGIPIVTKRLNSDGMGTWEYKIPLHWSNGTARTNNQLTLVGESRVATAYDDGQPFDRNNLGAVLKSTISRWSTISQQRDIGTRTTSSFIYKVGSYDFTGTLGWGGFAPPNANYDLPWRPAQERVTLISRYGVPLEALNEATGLYSATYTGHGSSMAIGTIEGARWNSSSSVYTCDYLTGNPATTVSLDPLSGWSRSSPSTAVLTMEAAHYGLQGIKLLGGGSVNNLNVKIDGARKLITLDVSYRVLSGRIKLLLQPANGSSPVGAVDTVSFSSTSWSTGSNSINLNHTQYATANTLFVRVMTEGTSSAYVDDIRVYPTEAFVKTYYYNPATAKLIGVVDENKGFKGFGYDPRGRLTHIKNNAGQIVSATTYKDAQ